MNHTVKVPSFPGFEPEPEMRAPKKGDFVIGAESVPYEMTCSSDAPAVIYHRVAPQRWQEEDRAELEKLRAENEALRAKLPRWIPSAESRLKLRDGQLLVISVPGHGCYAATYRAWSGDLPCHYKENDDIDAIADPDDAGHWVYVIPTPPAAPEQEPAP